MFELDKNSIAELNEAATLAGLNEFAEEIHQNAIDHGWWESERALPEILMLCVSELSEALEEYREGKPIMYCGVEAVCAGKYEHICRGGKLTEDGSTCKGIKPEGVAIELADCIIRILDYCAAAKIDIEDAIKTKHEYNKKRTYRHGNKKC